MYWGKIGEIIGGNNYMRESENSTLDQFSVSSKGICKPERWAYIFAFDLGRGHRIDLGWYNIPC